MNEKRVAAQLLLQLHEIIADKTLAARLVLDWAEEKRALLWPETRSEEKVGESPPQLAWADLPQLCGSLESEEPDLPEMATADGVSALLELEPFDANLLRLVVAIRQFPSIAALRKKLSHSGVNLLAILGALAGAPLGQAARRVRRSAAMELGLIEIDEGYLQTNWRLDKILDRGTRDEESLIEALVGPVQKASLEAEDFAHRAVEFDFLSRLLASAVKREMAGVNILLHGPPGTGKTELARTLAHAIGARLFAAGESDEDGDEPNRYVRLHALRRGQRLLVRRAGSMLLFDEMEDLFALPSGSYGQGSRSKLFINRLLEINAIPTIWTSNSIVEIDPAHLRRMSFVLKMDHAPTQTRARIISRIAGDEGHVAPEALVQLSADHPEVASIARVVLKSAAAAQGGAEDAELSARSLLVALRGDRPLPPARGAKSLDLSLFESDPPVGELVSAVSHKDSPRDFSLLLAGPPGTGKTALARHVADAINRPLLVRRASDLLSKWVGETEANIASAFAQARNDGAVLFFDEADSLFFDRAGARTSWEVTQVNELLTWMDDHDLPFIAATNFVQRLDPAAMRRFVFKLTLHELSPARAAHAFARFFGREAPASLRRLRNLTPGDFAVVARQLRFRPTEDVTRIEALLAVEAEARQNGPKRIGF